MQRGERTATETMRRRADHRGIERLPLLLALLLRVVQPGEREPLGAADPLQVDQDAGGEQRPGQRPAPRLVHTGHEAAAEGAVEAEQASGGALLPPLLRQV